MKKLSVAVFALSAVCVAAPAQAFHPSEENYGYVMPKKWQRQPQRAIEGPGLFGEPSPKMQWGAKSKREKSKKLARGSMSGGGRPGIAAVAPRTVPFANSYGAGSIVIDTAGRKLYYVKSSGSAYQYPIAVGKAGFSWSGTKTISKEVAWPDWRPPAEMLARRPDLPEHMEGGVRNPLGARALYLGSSLYRIHGTNDVKSIGTAASSGCFRMTNGNVVHLASMAGVGTKVHVLRKMPSTFAKAGRSSKSLRS